VHSGEDIPILLIVDVAVRREPAHHGVEVVGQGDRPHVALDVVDGDASLQRFRLLPFRAVTVPQPPINQLTQPRRRPTVPSIVLHLQEPPVRLLRQPGPPGSGKSTLVSR
jgi:hypothetical protein